MFAVCHIEMNKGDFLEDGYFNQTHIRSAAKLVNVLLKQLR
jgi:hypothetical protein